jgi:tetratricopeptide (TPR) repeat protein
VDIRFCHFDHARAAAKVGIVNGAGSHHLGGAGRVVQILPAEGLGRIRHRPPQGVTMPNLDAAAAAAPASPHDPIRLLLRAGKNDEAIVRLCGIVVTSPGDQEARELLFDAFFQKRDWAPALALIEQLAAERPDNALLQRSLIATLSNMKRFDEAIVRADRYVETHGENLMVLDALKVAHFYSGKVNEAIRYGQRGLTLRDREALQTPLPFALTEPSGPPNGTNVISYSLWGPAPFYGYGAMINLVQSRTVYPGWSCRFYIDATVPKACAGFLRDNGADVRMIEDEYPGVGLFQRFLVMNDRDVGRFLVRDCDARLSQAEADLVAQWIDSGKPFHVVRDHVLHNELMIGCLWAGRTDCGIDIVELMRRYFTFGPTAKYGHDQRMLGLMLWPLIRQHCLVHDKYYRLDGVETLPLPDPNSHFGAGRQNIEAVMQEVEQYGIPRVL